MPSDDLVSVVVPAYNHAKYVGQALESVINQTYAGPMELLVLDDGSTDGTWEVIREWQPALEKRFQRVVLKRQENQGVTRTLMRLLDWMRGSYLTSTASDDLMAPELVAESHSFLKNNPDYGAVYFDAELIDGDSRPVRWDEKRRVLSDPNRPGFRTAGGLLRHLRPDVDFLSDDFGTYESLLYGNYMPSAPFYRRELLDRHALYAEAAPLEDWYSTLQLAKHTRLKFIDRPGWAYRWYETNTAKGREKMLAITQATLRYEVEQVLASGDEAITARLLKHFRRDKTFFESGPVGLYKSKGIDGKKIIFRLGSRKFSFTYKK